MNSPNSLKVRLLSREVLPFYLALIALGVAALLVDAGPHLLDAVWVAAAVGTRWHPFQCAFALAGGVGDAHHRSGVCIPALDGESRPANTWAQCLGKRLFCLPRAARHWPAPHSRRSN
jgi:hypothetical protein